MENRVIFTIGYEGIDFDTFVNRLKLNNIDILVDVRQTPISRKKGFSKTRLREWLSEHGIGYEHIVLLGCPKPIRDRYRANGRWGVYKKDYMAFLELERGDEVARLAALAAGRSCALMCFEADFNFCHRSLITKKMVADHRFTELHIGVTKTAMAA